MLPRALLFCIVLGWPMQAGANGCADLYNAIKKAAMYCDFFCDQSRIEPLQLAYESMCIVRVIPPSPFYDDPPPAQAAMSEPLVGAAVFATAAAVSK